MKANAESGGDLQTTTDVHGQVNGPLEVYLWIYNTLERQERKSAAERRFAGEVLHHMNVCRYF